MKDQIMQEWEKMLGRGVMPMFEIELKDDEYLVVNLNLTTDGLQFNFDQNNLNVFFDGEITGGNGYYLLPFDGYTPSLDYMLEGVMGNLNEGFIGANDLYT